MPFTVNKQTGCGYWTMEATEENPTWHVDGLDGGGPITLSELHAVVCCEALNVHEQTGLTPAQLQARVAELEGALAAMVEYFQPYACGSADNRADALKEAREVLSRA